MQRRDLKPFKPPEPRALTPQQMARARKLKAVVDQPGWALIKDDIARRVLDRFAVPPPTTPGGLIAYSTFCIIRDGIGQLLLEVETEAALAKEEQE